MAVTLGSNQISGLVTPTGDISGNVVTSQYMELNATRPNVTFISRCGHNSLFILADGIMYSTSASAGVYNNNTTGRGLSGIATGYGLDGMKQVPVPTTYPIASAGGGWHGVAWALDTAGQLFTWGINTVGQCGNGTVAAIPNPILVATGVVKVYDDPSNGSYDVNYNRLFILKTDGYVYAAGYNGYGQLGIGSTTNASVFTKIVQTGGISFPANSIVSLWNLGSVYGMTIAQTTDGHIWVCGLNNYGQLGLGSTANASFFTDTSGVWNGNDYTMVIQKVGGGWGYLDSAAQSHGTVLMWLKNPGGTDILRTCGSNVWGGIGDGTAVNITTPKAPTITLGTNVIADIATCGGGPVTIHVLLTSGALWGWGYNSYGQLGVNSVATVSTPTQIFASGVRRLLHHGLNGYNYSYFAQSIIELTDGSIYVTGYNGVGQLGVGDATQRQVFVPCLINNYIRKVPGAVKFIGHSQVQSQHDVFVAVTANNTIYAWGVNNYNGVTIQTTNHVYYPVQFTLNKGKRNY